MRSNVAVIVLIVIAVLVPEASACYEASKPAATTPPGQGVEGEVAVIATYARFQPSAISLKKEQAIQLRVTATDTNHTFTVDELGINIAVGRGQTITREIQAERAGAFTFYCAVPGHRSAGMEGTLKIAE